MVEFSATPGQSPTIWIEVVCIRLPSHTEVHRSLCWCSECRYDEQQEDQDELLHAGASAK